MEFKNIKAIFFLVFFLIGSLQAQRFNKLFDLYDSRQIYQLKAMTAELEREYPSNPNLEFFKAVFFENGETAIQVYEKLLPDAKGRLRSYILKKLVDYYYAKGYYVTAKKYEQNLKEPAVEIQTSEKPKKVESEKISANLVIQVGAFGLKDNANQLRNMLAIQNIPSRIVERVVKGKKLYCVWIDGKNNFEDTNEYAERLKKKYQLQYRILKP